MEWGIMPTLDLVNLVNELASTLDEPPRNKIAKTFDFQPWQMRGLMQNQRTPTFCHYCKEQGHWKRGCHKFKHMTCSLPSNQSFSGLPNSQ